jgi:alkylation response protein AidB-like acyl-CoA dehydrogenase
MNVTTNMSVSRTNQVLQKVREILPEIVARGDEIEAKGRVPLDLLDKVTQTGAFRMCLPDCFGGEALSLRGDRRDRDGGCLGRLASDGGGGFADHRRPPAARLAGCVLR